MPYVTPKYHRLRNYASIHWPIVWRARYEMPATLILFLAAITMAAPHLSRVRSSLHLNQDWVTATLEFVAIVIFAAAIGFFLYWANKLAEVAPPTYARRVINAPRFFTLLIIFGAFISILFVTWTMINDRSLLDGTKTLHRAWREREFLNADLSKNMWAMWLLTAPVAALFLKVRNLFNLATAVGSLVLLLVLSLVATLAVIALGLIGQSIGIAYVAPGSADPRPWLPLSQDTYYFIAFVVFLVIVSSPLLYLFRSLRSKVQLRFARICSAITIWNAVTIFAGALFVALLTTAKLWTVLGLPTLASADDWERWSALPGADYVVWGLLFGTFFVLPIELATVLAVRLMVLPETESLWPPGRAASRRGVATPAAGQAANARCDVFISHASEDAAIAAKVAAWARSAGCNVWYDDDLVGGERYGELINRHVDAARAVIVIWSQESIGSDWVIYEARRAHQQSKHIPLRLSDLPPERLPPPYPAVLHVTEYGDWDQLRGALERLGIKCSGPH